MSSKKARTSSSLPTKDEQLQLRETESLLSSNMLHMQLSEMLNAIRYTGCSKKNKKSTEKWILKLMSELNNAGSQFNDTEISEKWLHDRKIDVELENHGEECTSLMFQTPDQIKIVGSYSLETLMIPNGSVDISVSMPSHCFDKRDILNHIYFDKRKLYLGVIMLYLKEAMLEGIVGSVEWAHYKGDIRKPTLVIKPSSKSSFVVNIYPTISSDVFAPSQLRLERNNVRPHWWMSKLQINRESGCSSGHNMDPTVLKPTPHYNMAVMEDVMMVPLNDCLVSGIVLCPILRDVIVAAKVWLSRRGHRCGSDSLDGHLCTVLIVMLAQQGLITSKMSVVSALMCFFNFVKDMKSRSPVAVDAGFPTSISFDINDPSSLKSNLDSSSTFVVSWRVSESSLEQIRCYASSALCTLQTSSRYESLGADSCFWKLFQSSTQFHLEYDILIHVRMVSADETSATSREGKHHSSSAVEALLNLTEWQYTTSTARSLVIRALGDRALCVHSHHCPSNSDYATLGIRYNVANYRRRVDRGPSAESEDQCRAYKEFWGNVSSLRRFRDGTIVESVVWGESSESPSSSLGPDEVTFEIVSHILRRHLFNSRACGDDVIAPSLSFSEVLPNSTKQSLLNSDQSSTNLHRLPIEALDRLRQNLSSDLKDFPLTIDSVRGMHPSLRYTSYFPPVKHPIVEMNKTALNSFAGKSVNRLVESISVVASFGLSSKWPTNIPAIRCVKSALIIRLSQCLKKQFKIHSIVHEEFLDIFFSGFLFRMHFLVANELALLESNASIMKSEYILCRSLKWSPLHNAAIHALSSRHEVYADTVRLFSYWAHSNMLSCYLTHEVLELFVGYAFMSQSSDGAQDATDPSYSQGSYLFAFFKTLLRISEFDWSESPMVVDFGGYFSSEIDSCQSSVFHDQAQKSLDSVRHRNHAAGMVITSIYNDVSGFDPEYCTRVIDKSIASIILQRIRLSLNNFIVGNMTPDIDPLFVLAPSNKLLNFNVLLKFQTSLCCGIDSYTGSDKLNGVVSGAEKCRVNVFSNISRDYADGSSLISRNEPFPHPLQMQVCNKLRDRFGDIALFFYNHLSGGEIGVMWKPSLFAPSGFALLHSQYHCLCAGAEESGSTVVINPASVVAEMLSLSEGMLSEVQFL